MDNILQKSVCVSLKNMNAFFMPVEVIEGIDGWDAEAVVDDNGRAVIGNTLEDVISALNDCVDPEDPDVESSTWVVLKVENGKVSIVSEFEPAIDMWTVECPECHSPNIFVIRAYVISLGKICNFKVPLESNGFYLPDDLSRTLLYTDTTDEVCMCEGCKKEFPLSTFEDSDEAEVIEGPVGS